MENESHRRIFIGDVHGHYDGLMTLLAAIAPGDQDRVYFLGDLIDRGPKSAQVVEFVKESPYTCILGNHEQLLLDSFPNSQPAMSPLQAWLYSGGYATVASYGDDGIPIDHLDWMRSLPTHLDLGDVWLAHAGVHPKFPIEEQTPHDYCWIRDEFHSIPQPYFDNKLIIVGHTITFTLPGVSPGEIAQGNGWLDIDTGAYHPKSGWLTGLDLTNRMIYQVNVFQDTQRVLPLDEAVTRIEPSQVLARRKVFGSR
ncbi:metallophosphoesterase family protein [Geitlerinema sp. PCC 7407]|uniref:metallophosphoesterase family protein n=1 Tax=Geitlerinema sp. PCC 7407 TaxID=1173025 RepID=UPI00029F9680|nr:metallophosphoesterase family protein [Geitlerinema sp. PCC 7407]AFY66077.1 metallophosphoesterase [Geitlerinema sp. PCC 7407]